MREWSIVRVYRWCARCARWRSIGNFAHNHRKGKTSNAHTCMRCWRPGIKNANRRGYVLTDRGRAYLHPESRGRGELTVRTSAQCSGVEANQKKEVGPFQMWDRSTQSVSAPESCTELSRWR